MTVLNKAKSHFHNILAQGLQKVEVPEWETTIYYKPATTFAQEQKVMELHHQGKLVEALVETLLTRSLTEDGKKMFTMADKVTLMREVDPTIIVRIVGEMNNAKDVDDEVGN